MIVFGPPKFSSFAIALGVLLVLDGIWLTSAFKMKWYPAAAKTRLHIVLGGGLAWGALALGHSMVRPKSWGEAVVFGSVFGFIVYAVYNGTDYAIQQNWTGAVAARDLVWGTFASTLTAIIVYACVHA